MQANIKTWHLLKIRTVVTFHRYGDCEEAEGEYI